MSERKIFGYADGGFIDRDPNLESKYTPAGIIHHGFYLLPIKGKHMDYRLSVVTLNKKPCIRDKRTGIAFPVHFVEKGDGYMTVALEDMGGEGLSALDDPSASYWVDQAGQVHRKPGRKPLIHNGRKWRG